jgi:hypothetical protein
MRVELVPVSRRWPWPLWALGLFAAWLSLAAAAFFLGRSVGVDAPPCLFKKITGLPCPTCGAGRGALCIAKGDLLGGWLHNPLLFTLLGGVAAAALLRMTTKRTLRWHLTPTQKRMLLRLFLALVLANWAYVIFYVG